MNFSDSKIKTRSIVLTASVLAASSILVSCAPVGAGLQRMGTIAHKEMAAVDRKMRDYLDAEGIDGGAEPKQVEPSYCYRSLGQIECYKTPLAGADDRMIGKQVPKPAFDEDNMPYPSTKPPVVVVQGPTGEEFIKAADHDDYVVAETAPAGLPVPANQAYTGELTYEVPESAITAREEVPQHRRPRELIPVFEGVE